jgi:transposase
MSFDLFMNDTCPRCRRPITLAVIEPHAINRELAVHKFKCSNCGHVTTKTLLRKESKVSSNLAA